MSIIGTRSKNTIKFGPIALTNAKPGGNDGRLYQLVKRIKKCIRFALLYRY